jgi:group I intron endonuclease
MATYLQSSPGIYKITSTTSGKMYIGCASNIRTRINGHLYDLRRDNHNNSYLQRAWNKYGEENFVFEIIEKCDISDLHSKEHYGVNKLNCLDRSIGYNLKSTDPNGKSVHSEETKEKLRSINKGKKPSAACIEAGKIYNASEECKINLIEARKKLKDIDFNIVNAHKKKSIKNIITGEVYESLAVASNILNIPKYELSRRILGKRKNNTNLIYL